MNRRHARTCRTVFTDPVSRSIQWAEIEALLVAIGAKAIEGSGSRVKFERDGLVAAFHRPHPAKEAKPYQVRDARAFLVALGFTADGTRASAAGIVDDPLG